MGREDGGDIVARGGLWDLFTANPFTVLDQTGHMPYTESSRHLGEALPEDDRLRSLYLRDGRCYPEWIAGLESRGFGGVGHAGAEGLLRVERRCAAAAPARLRRGSGEYVAIGEISRKDHWSWYEAAERDRRAGKIKSVDVARARRQRG